jgi:hypothetical protein
MKPLTIVSICQQAPAKDTVSSTLVSIGIGGDAVQFQALQPLIKYPQTPIQTGENADGRVSSIGTHKSASYGFIVMELRMIAHAA